jgi:hypothetical protein
MGIDVPRLARFAPLLVGTVAFVWAIGADLNTTEIAKLEREFARHQAVIDLAVAKIQLKAADGTITPEEAQSEIDAWVRNHRSLMQKQAERAAQLDRLTPLDHIPTPDTPSADAITLTPAQERLRELDALEASEIKSLAAKATSIEELQDRVDQWSRTSAGVAIRQQREWLVRQLDPFQPLGTQPVVLEASPHARPQELEAMDFQEAMVRRLQALRQRHPTATPEEMQDLVDADKAFFHQNMAEMQTRLSIARREALAEEVERLHQKTALLGPPDDQ